MKLTVDGVLFKKRKYKYQYIPYDKKRQDDDAYADHDGAKE